MHKYKLDNGLTVLLTPQASTKAVTILILAGVGSRYESDKLAGISHFLEHMMFKGTPTRPTAFSISQELDSVGAEYNAYTTLDHTGYWIKINSEHTEKGMDILSDMIWNSKLEQKEINKESGTIIEEINMYEDDPRRDVEDVMLSVTYAGNTLGRLVIGFKETVKSITSSQMKKYKKEYYTPNNLVLSIAGDIDLNITKELVNKYFNQNIKQTVKKKFVPFKNIQSKPRLKVKYKDSHQAHLSFGFVGPKYIDKNVEAARILSVVLGGSMSSRLFMNIREKRGLCYFIRASADSFQDTGLIEIHAGLDKTKISEAIKLILLELNKIKSKGISAKELSKAKEIIKGRTILDLEESSSVADWYGRQQLLINKTETPEQIFAKIDKISTADIQRLAHQIFQTKKINLALIGPFKDEKEFSKLLKI